MTIIGSVTVTCDHLPAFSVDPPGVLVLTRHQTDADTWLTVKRADPEVRFSDELLTEFFNGGDNDGMYPGVRLETQCEHKLMECRTDGGACYNGALLHIDGRDKHVVYRICEFVPDKGNWVARWPD